MSRVQALSWATRLGSRLSLSQLCNVSRQEAVDLCLFQKYPKVVYICFFFKNLPNENMSHFQNRALPSYILKKQEVLTVKTDAIAGGI